MKSKMKTSGNSVLSNRTVIGLICIVLALALTFGVAPIVNRLSNQKVSAVLVKRNVERGHIITAEDVEVVQVVPANLSSKTVGSTDYVIGKYAASNLYAGQMMIADLVTEKGNSAEDVLAELNGEQVAISLQIPSFAAGISGKVANGDIVSIIVYSQKENKSYVPDALRYVRVITTTTAEEVDCDRKEDGEQSVTITLLASPEQAELLAYYEATAKLHFSLVCRGDKKIAGEFLREEAEYLQSEEFALALSALWGEEGETAEEEVVYDG